ncbi:phosphate-selective porin OprO and OprP [Nitrosovibrio tenuis]|uniref:Phosphate-selective porin OprO and OprP n=2 Tax=Nitrosovibrio tenuis TaxID=1233 RepID=A0A1H7R070_9PROT|nr:phosphate-selective porin OprO and OprP [Nitrosovibrio tenuis]
MVIEIGINGRSSRGASFSQDSADVAFLPFGSQLAGDQDCRNFNWRGTYATQTGIIYGLNFKYVNDFAAGAFPGSVAKCAFQPGWSPWVEWN